MNARSSTISSASAVTSAEARVVAYDWQAVAGELDGYGCAVLPKLLSPAECESDDLAAQFRIFEATSVDMEEVRVILVGEPRGACRIVVLTARHHGNVPALHDPLSATDSRAATFGHFHGYPPRRHGVFPRKTAEASPRAQPIQQQSLFR